MGHDPRAQTEIYARDVEARRGWIDAAIQVSETGTTDVQCPECTVDALQADWISADASGHGAGEYRVWCSSCGAQNYMRAAMCRKP